MLNSVAESIKDLEEVITTNNKMVDLLRAFEELSVKGLDEYEYHLLCETGMRYSDDLGRALTNINTMPYLVYDERDINYFVYHIEGTDFEIWIPSGRERNIEVRPKQYYEKYEDVQRFCSSHHDTQISIYKHQIDASEDFLKTKSLIKKSKYIFPWYSSWRAVVSYLISLPMGRYKQRVSEKLIEYRENYQKCLEKRAEVLKSAKENRETQQQLLKVYVRLFLEWTSKVYVYDGCSGYKKATYTRQGNKIVMKEE